MIKALSFDDVLLVPKFSSINSRKEVSIQSNLFDGLDLEIPIISANMDTVTGHEMASAMIKQGAGASLHRFSTVQGNVEEFKKSPKSTIVSIGVGSHELERAAALYAAGAYNFVIDVAHGASHQVVTQYDLLREITGSNANIIIGNIATGKNIRDIKSAMTSRLLPDAYKVGIGGGSLCTTRIVTGCGLPTLYSVMDCVKEIRGEKLIADGGIKNSGDIVKSLAAGADAVMVGSLLAGTEETPGEIVAFETKTQYGTAYLNTYANYKEAPKHLWHKKYRGSASKESYEAQNKVADHRTPEGEATVVKYKGSVESVIQNLAAGIRSGFSYLGANNLEELWVNADFVEITAAGRQESIAHGKVI